MGKPLLLAWPQWYRRQGDEGDNFYIVGEGTFAARIAQASGQDRTVFTYEGKGAFGELALMYNCPRAASVQVTSCFSTCCLVPRLPFFVFSPQHLCSRSRMMKISSAGINRWGGLGNGQSNI